MHSFLLLLVAIVLLFEPHSASDPDASKIAAAELAIWKKVVKEVKDAGYTIRGFYHTSTWQRYWKEVIVEQLMLMDGMRVLGGRYRQDSGESAKKFQLWNKKFYSSVLKESDQLYLNVAAIKPQDFSMIKAAVESVNLRNSHRVVFNANRTIPRGTYKESNDTHRKLLTADLQISEAEYSTVTAMQDYCTAMGEKGKKAYVYYLHNKGGCCLRGAVASWRKAMNTFMIELPSICLRALHRNGYSACGFEYQDAHYSGNYFWANCEHVRALPRLYTRFDAWEAEKFIFNVSTNILHNRMFGENCGYSAWKCHGVDHYEHVCPPESYLHKIQRYATTEDLPPNNVATISQSNTSWVKDVCGKMRMVPYKKQDGWSDWHKFPMQFLDRTR